MSPQTQEPTAKLSEDEVDAALEPLLQTEKRPRLREREVDAALEDLYPEKPGLLGAAAGGALDILASGAGQAKIMAQKLGAATGMSQETPFFGGLEAGLRGMAEQVYPSETRGRGGLPEQLASGTGSIVGSVPAMLTGPGGAAFQFGAAQGVPLYYDVKAATGSEEKATEALLFGNAIGQLERFGAEKFAGSIVKKLASPALAGAVQRVALTQALEGAGGEAATEVAQQALTDLVHEHLTGEDLDNWERIKEILPPAILLGGAFGAIDSAIQRPAREAQAPGGPGIAQETTSPQTTQEAIPEAQAPSAAGEAAGIVQEPGDEAFAKTLRESTARQGGERRQAFEGERKAYAKRLDVVSALVDGEDVPPAVLARYPGAIEQAAAMRERVKAEVEGMGVPYHEELPEKGLRPGEVRTPETEPEAPPKPQQELDIEDAFTRLEEITAENKAAEREIAPDIAKAVEAIPEEAPRKKALYEMSSEELSALAETERSRVAKKESDVFSPEELKRINRLFRQQNSSNNDVADKASAEIDALEKTWTDEQKNALYGIGETGPTVEDIELVRTGVQNVMATENAVDLATELRYRARDLVDLMGRKKAGTFDPENLSATDQRAMAVYRAARERAQELGVPFGRIEESALKQYAGQFSDPEDAAFMLQDLKGATIEGDVEAETDRALAEAEPKLLHAGIPITGEDIKADIAKLIGRKRDLADKPDVLGNRQTLAFVRKAVDYLSPHRRAKEARLGKGQEGAVDYVASEELRRGRTRSRTERAERETDRPILKTLRAGKIPSEGESDADPGYIRYLTARQAKDVNRIVAERQPEVADAKKLLDAGEISKADYENIVGHFASGEEIGVGMSNAEADRILASVESGPKAAHYARLAKQFDKLTKETRDLWRKYGLHEESAISAMEKANPNYAPARSDLEEDEALPVGRGLTTRGKESKLRTGRTTLPDDPIAYAIAQRNQAISRGEKNNVLRQWQENIDQNPNFWAGVAKVTKGRTMKAVVDGVVREVPDPSYGNEKNVVPFKKDGKQFYIEVDKGYSELARALNNADSGMVGSLDHAVRVVGGLTRTFAKLRTVYSVEFLATNLARDVGSGVFTSAEEGRRFSRKWAKGIPSAFKDLSKWKLSEEGEYPSASLKEYVESGAPVSYLDFKTVKETAKEIEAYIKQNEPGAAKKITRAARGALALMEGASDIVENATRYSAFKAARAEGKSIQEAALIAKNLTVNFERKGELGYVMNALWAFSSAGIAGSARTVKLLKNPRARKLVIGAVAGMALWDQIGRHLMGQDEDGEDKWDKISKGLKGRYFIIPKWWEEDTSKFIRIPMPPGLAWMLYGGEEIGAALSGRRDGAEATLNVASALADAFNPLGGGSEKGAHKAGKMIAPTVLDPLVDILANKDFAGHTIRPDEGKVHAYQFWPSVSETSRIVAQKLNEITGGDQYEPGAIDISPEHIDFITDYVFGGLGQFMRKAYTTAQALESDEPVDERNVPILSRFTGEISPWASKQDFDDAISHMQAEEKRHTGGKALRKDRAPMLERAFEVRREIEKLDKKMDALREAGDSGAADELAKRMDSLRKRFLAQYKARN